MLSFKPDVVITILWCVFGIIYRILPGNLDFFRGLTFILIIVFSKKHMKLSNMHFLCLIFCVYYFAVSVFHEGLLNSLSASISMLSWLITLVVFSSYSKSQSDLRKIIDFVIYSGLFISVIFLINNKLFSNEINVYLTKNVLVNRNTVIYSVFPAYIFQLIKIERSAKKKKIDVLLIAVIALACLQVNSRTMYISLIISTSLVFNKQLIALIKRGRIFGLIFYLLLMVGIVYSVFKLLPDEYITREFTNGLTTSDTGRLDLWREAIGLVDDPVFGMGPSFYSKNVSYSFANYGAHSTFVDLYVAAGIFAPVLFFVILLYFVRKDMYILSIIAPAFLTFLVEAGRIFFPYMLLVFAWFIIEGAKQYNITIEEYLYRIMNNVKDGESDTYEE